MQGSHPGSAPVLEGFSSKQNGVFVDGESQFPRKCKSQFPGAEGCGNNSTMSANCLKMWLFDEQ